LRPVVRHEADPLDVDVVHLPAIASVVHLVVERQLATVVESERRADDGLVTVDRLAPEDHLLAAVPVDFGHVRALDQVGKEPYEFLSLSGCSPVPVLPQGPLGRLAEVEDLLGNLGDRYPAPTGVRTALQLRVPEDLEHTIDPSA
jgi:hypothetical protein